MRTYGSAASPLEHLRFPEWQHAYHAAVLETDSDKLLERVQAAESAISKRLQAMPENSDTLIERHAIFDAMGTLRFLRLDVQKKLPRPCRPTT
jgi:hypothetical protein